MEILATFYSSNYMTGQMSDGSMRPPRRLLLTSDMSVQTEEQFERSKEQSVRSNSSDSQELSDLSASDLANILKWSSAISRDINLSSGEFLHLSVKKHALI